MLVMTKSTILPPSYTFTVTPRLHEMQSTRSISTFFLRDIPNDHRCLRLHVTIYTLAVISTLVLLMLLIWHMSTIHVVEKFDMPHMWEVDFVKQQLTGTKKELWIMVFILVPIDLVHALLCLDYYHGRLHIPTRDDRSRRAHKKKQNILAEDEVQTTRDTDGPNSHTRTPSFARHVVSPIYHPFFHASAILTTPLLLIIYDTLQIALLSLHTFSYFANIAPSKAFCSTSAVLHYPTWAFQHQASDWRQGPERPPQLSMKARCERINWNIHVAGGFSATVAAMLGALHVVAVGVTVWHCIARGWRKKYASQTRKSGRSTRDEYGDVEMEDWTHPPRDVDSHPGIATGDGENTTPPQTVTHAVSISEEERSIGAIIRQRRARPSKGKSGNAQERLVAFEEAKWAEALLECLVP